MQNEVEEKDKTLKEAEILIESYNDLFNKGIDIYLKEAIKEEPENSEHDFNMLENIGKKIISGNTQEILKVYDYRDKLYEEWNKTPIKELGNITPEEFFNKIEKLDVLIKIFSLYSVKSDYKMPDAFLHRLKDYGNESVDMILKLAVNRVHLCFDTIFNTFGNIPDDIREYFIISLTAIETLGSWKIEEVVISLIDLMKDIPTTFFSEDNTHNMNHLNKIKRDEIDGYIELYRSNIRDALISIGSASIEPLLDVLGNTFKYNENHEYLAMALAEVGRKNRSDRIYRVLKNIFLNMNNKIVGSSCLSVYGDGRAIVTLKGYIEKNINNLDKETFYEIKGAVEDLGGNMNDIKFHEQANLEFYLK